MMDELVYDYIKEWKWKNIYIYKFWFVIINKVNCNFLSKLFDICIKLLFSIIVII